MKREAKKAEKTAKKQAHKSVEGQVSNVNEVDDDINTPDISSGKYGNAPMNQSKHVPSYKSTNVQIKGEKMKYY